MRASASACLSHSAGARLWSVARNAGLSSCTTEWVYFFDSDDLFSSSLIADAFEALSHDATCDMIFVPTRQELEGHVKVRSHRRTTSPAVHILNSQFSTVSMILRTAFVRQQGGWDENLTVWDDWALAVRLLMARPHCLWLREAYHHISIHASSQTNTGFPATCQATLRAMQAVLSLTEQMTAEVGMQAQCRRALFLRARIMQGKLLQAGDANGAEAYALFAQAALPQPSWREKWMADALKVYTAKGGRGAWRAALLML